MNVSRSCFSRSLFAGVDAWEPSSWFQPCMLYLQRCFSYTERLYSKSKDDKLKGWKRTTERQRKVENTPSSHLCTYIIFLSWFCFCLYNAHMFDFVRSGKRDICSVAGVRNSEQKSFSIAWINCSRNLGSMTDACKCWLYIIVPRSSFSQSLSRVGH